MLAYKYAVTPAEIRDYDEEYLKSAEIEESNVIIKLWDQQEIGATEAHIGFAGSPTKVKQIESVVLEAGTFQQIENTKAGFETLIKELMHEHIIG